MQQLRYFVVDAFASGVFTGNPAGVCLLDRWLPDALLQAIAAENNLAETAFVVADEHKTRLRWFSPLQEVPLCGHATLAAAYVVCTHLRPGLEEITFETPSGALAVSRRAGWFELAMPRFELDPVKEPPAALRDGAGVEAAAVFKLDVDPNFYLIVDDEKTVHGLRPRLDLLAELHPYGVVVTARGSSADFVSRYFAPGYGIPEDPVTGSIHAALTPYWAEQLGRTSLRALQLSSRGGELHCRLEPDRVCVAGQIAPYLEGRILVPS